MVQNVPIYSIIQFPLLLTSNINMVPLLTINEPIWTHYYYLVKSICYSDFFSFCLMSFFCFKVPPEILYFT